MAFLILWSRLGHAVFLSPEQTLKLPLKLYAQAWKGVDTYTTRYMGKA